MEYKLNLAACAQSVQSFWGLMPFGEKRRDDWIEASKSPGEVCLCVIHFLEERRGGVEVPVLQQKKCH